MQCLCLGFMRTGTACMISLKACNSMRCMLITLSGSYVCRHGSSGNPLLSFTAIFLHECGQKHQTESSLEQDPSLDGKNSISDCTTLAACRLILLPSRLWTTRSKPTLMLKSCFLSAILIPGTRASTKLLSTIWYMVRVSAGFKHPSDDFMQ